MVFERLDELARESRAALGEPYSSYIRALQACLVAVRGQHVEIGFYNGLEDELRIVIKEVSTQAAKNDIAGPSKARAGALQRVDNLLQKFQQYCTDVEVAYLQLRKDSLV
jgi:hypothetical protein